MLEYAETDLPEEFMPGYQESICLEEFIGTEAMIGMGMVPRQKSILCSLRDRGIIDQVPTDAVGLARMTYACWQYLEAYFPETQNTEFNRYGSAFKTITKLSLEPNRREEYETLRDIIAFLLAVPPASRKMNVLYNPFGFLLGGVEASMSIRNPEVQQRRERLVAQQIGSVQLLREIVALYPRVSRSIYPFINMKFQKHPHVLLNILYGLVQQEILLSERQNQPTEIPIPTQSYLAQAQDPQFNPGGVYPEEIGHLLRLLDDPVVAEELEERYPEIFVGLSNQEQLWVVRLLERHQEEHFEAVQELFTRFGAQKGTLIQVLQLCFQDGSDQIIRLFNTLLEQENFEVVERFITQAFELVQLGEEVEAQYGNDPEIGAFVRRIAFGQGARFLQRLCDTGYDAAVLELPDFQADVVRTGSLLKAIVKLRGKVNTTLLDQILTQDIQVDIVSPPPTPGESLSTEIFDTSTRDMVIQNLRRAYSSEHNPEASDDAWLAHLEDQLDQDLENPDVKWVLLRNNEGRTIGLCKYKPLGKTEDGRMRFYWGTLYVDPEFQGGYSAGTYLQELTFEHMRSDAQAAGCEEFQVEGSVAPFNVDGLCRHVTGFDAVLDGVTTEGESGPLFHIIWYSDGARARYETKDRSLWSEAQIHAAVERLAANEDLKPLDPAQHCMVGQWDLRAPDFIERFQALAENKHAVITQMIPAPDAPHGQVEVVIELPQAA